MVPIGILAAGAMGAAHVELRRFVDCMAGKADPALLDVDRAIEALVLSLATRRSLAERRTIELMSP